ncbi:glycoside hydrolase family 3 C-terminal domain-containing protein [Dactylosporangium vinaceum]|uniref:Glycoside hydrolase family 3 C-terminal domain-containing protein n=1 Tax=Dactylosporangium vinaceum TaxID=53362 RepID=A0ABV5M398_9ACTN|nr:glycoside hydrolase family 3 C-terminal domain-containing protein [Dactylosporangium vinaceum]UAB99733.1 glycoside hydrolase family 3 C-terminal domain-containing protein [Dactylosporangium vinaceum]
MNDVTDLTLEQKASLLSGHNMWSTKRLDEAGLPSIVLTDGPHGVRRQTGAADHLGISVSEPATCFPPAVAVGSSWDPEVAARLGQAVGREARALGVSVLLGPGVNIKRSPLCGRNFEYYSEDPYLSGVLGSAYTRAMQAEGVGASVKHFAANNQETDRMRVSADVDERTLREIYLPAFERVVTEAVPATVMCSYNRINGVSAAQNRWLLTDLLRDEWGFTGAVVSDWGAVGDRVAALSAGLDLEMPGNGGVTDREIVDAVRSGALDESVVDEAVRRVLALAEAWPAAGWTFDADAHHALARDLAAQCAVLLKNDSRTLPLDTAGSVAVIGALAAEPRYQGSGSSRVNPTRLDTALDSIRVHAEAYGQTVAWAPGFTADGSGDAEALRAEAVRVAAAADVAVVFAGLGDKEESEGFDRTHLDLPAAQVEVIRAVAAAARRTVVVLANGGVVSLEGWHDDVEAILEGFLLGQAGGGALADLLYGIANPSGHLAETLPLRLQDTPSYLTFPGEQQHVRYGEGVMVGYRYYTSVEAPVRYPFGHGLTYTTFHTRHLAVTVTGDDTAEVTVTVANTGARAGSHVIQVYVATDAGPVRHPARELRAFAKVALEPGEERTVTLTLDRRAFAYWDIMHERWVVASGQYRIQVGTDAATVVAEEPVKLGGDPLVTPLSMDSTVGEWFAHPVAGPALMRGMTAAMTPEQRAQAEQQQDQLRMVESMPMRVFIGFLGQAVPQAALDQLIEASREAR